MYLKRKLCIVENDLSFEIGRISVMRACEIKKVSVIFMAPPVDFVNPILHGGGQIDPPG